MQWYGVIRKYNIRLVSYKGTKVGLQVWDEGAPWEGTREEAEAYRIVCLNKNPGGDYVVEESLETVTRKTVYEHLLE